MVIKLHHALLGFFVFALGTSLLRNTVNLTNNIPFYNQLQSQYDKEKIRFEKLKLNAAKTQDPFETEKLLRNKLGLIKANEQIVVIPDTLPGVTITPGPSP